MPNGIESAWPGGHESTRIPPPIMDGIIISERESVERPAPPAQLPHNAFGAPVQYERDSDGFRMYRCNICEWEEPDQDFLHQNFDLFSEAQWVCLSCIEDAESDRQGADAFCGCDSCREERGETGLIQSYSYVPAPSFFRSEKEVKRILEQQRKAHRRLNPVALASDDTPFLAFELEIENWKNDRTNEYLMQEVSCDWNYGKRDGSLNNGFEIVSHPFTWALFQECEDLNWREMLQSCKDAGYRSFKTETCGMHVHISKRAFSNYHLYRFLRIFYYSKPFTFWLSKRTSRGDFDQWASFEGRGSRDRMTTLTRKAKDKYYGSKYEAVNLAHEESIEVRIFKGTLDPDSFQRNVETVYAAYAYTLPLGKVPTRDITPKGFAEFVAENRKEFPGLFTQFWIKGRLVSEVEREGVLV